MEDKVAHELLYIQPLGGDSNERSFTQKTYHANWTFGFLSFLFSFFFLNIVVE